MAAPPARRCRRCLSDAGASVTELKVHADGDSRRRKLPRTYRRSVSAQSLWGPPCAWRNRCFSFSWPPASVCARPLVVREVAEASEALSPACGARRRLCSSDSLLSAKTWRSARPTRGAANRTVASGQPRRHDMADLGRDTEHAQLAAAHQLIRTHAPIRMQRLRKALRPRGLADRDTGSRRPDRSGSALDQMKQAGDGFGEIAEFLIGEGRLQKLEDEAKKAQKGEAMSNAYKFPEELLMNVATDVPTPCRARRLRYSLSRSRSRCCRQRSASASGAATGRGTPGNPG